MQCAKRAGAPRESPCRLASCFRHDDRPVSVPLPLKYSLVSTSCTHSAPYSSWLVVALLHSRIDWRVECLLIEKLSKEASLNGGVRERPVG